MWLINMIRKWLARRRHDERLEQRYNIAIAEFGRTIARFDASCLKFPERIPPPPKTEKNGA